MDRLRRRMAARHRVRRAALDQAALLVRRRTSLIYVGTTPTRLCHSSKSRPTRSSMPFVLARRGSRPNRCR